MRSTPPSARACGSASTSPPSRPATLASCAPSPTSSPPAVRRARFMIELTEEALLRASQFQLQVAPMLREIGAKISIDDFGVGYSSLSTLADITADEIKVDRSFITAIHERPRNQSLLRAIESVGDALRHAGHRRRRRDRSRTRVSARPHAHPGRSGLLLLAAGRDRANHQPRRRSSARPSSTGAPTRPIAPSSDARAEDGRDWPRLSSSSACRGRSAFRRRPPRTWRRSPTASGADGW